MATFDRAVLVIIANADEYQGRKPTLRTLLEEVSELAYALEGEHQHTPEQELEQIGGIVINWLRRIYASKKERKHPSMDSIQDQ